MHMHSRLLVVMPLVIMLGGCQAYDWVYQPNADREGTHFLFKVEQPSKADILFVIDNSSSMLSKQAALADSINVLLGALSPQDTRYRIGITSTDAIGFADDCIGNVLPAPYSPGAKGNCDPRNHSEIRRPHDGALGRLLAVYDPDVFKTDAAYVDTVLNEIAGRGVTLDPDLRTKLAYLMPTGPFTHPPQFSDPAIFVGFTGEAGARWVIDREAIRLEACQVCATLHHEDNDALTQPIACDAEAAAYATCADPIAQVLVQAYFRANISGLGNRGMGWEEGLRSSQLAVGIDPRDEGKDPQGNPTALKPANDLTRVADVAEHDGANTYKAMVEDTGLPLRASWLRDEALLAVMYVSDEEDCSMPADLWSNHCAYETGCGDAWVRPPDWSQSPVGSMCYQEEAQTKMLSTTRMAELMVAKKGSTSRVAIGVIAGVTQTGQPPLQDRQATPSDCAWSRTQSALTNECSCLTGVDLADPDCGLWCLYTENKGGTCVADNTFCEGMAGRRYVAYANRFSRRTYESVCREGDGAFGPSMAKFAQIATLACFELSNVWPAGTPPDGSLITVKRASKSQTDACVALGADETACQASPACAFAAGACYGRPPSTLPTKPAGSTELGWYYEPVENKVCLTGLDRLIGDVYDIFVLNRDKLDFTN
jgi:hypothetical protein